MFQRYAFVIVVAAAALGWLLAAFFTPSAGLDAVMQFAKTLFLSTLKLIVAPLVFFSLLSGVLRLKEARAMRALGGATIVYYLTTTAVAICIGLGVVYWLHPWTNHPPLGVGDTSAMTMLSAADGSVGAVFSGLLQQMIVNPFTALAELNVLGILTNGLAFGLALLVTLPVDSPVIVGIHQITEAIYRLAGWAMRLVPVGVAAIVYELTLTADATLLAQLASFVAVVVGATLLHGMVVLPLIARMVGRVSLTELAKRLGHPFVVALSTSSSAATLPVTLRAADELGVDRATASFVLPLGATINMDGTALFEGIAAIFLAHLFGIELTALTTAVIFIVAMLASVGAPGIPSGSMAGMQMVLLAVGIPLEGIAILLLVERPLDTIRTAVNVEGDLIGSIVVDRALAARS